MNVISCIPMLLHCLLKAVAQSYLPLLLRKSLAPVLMCPSLKRQRPTIHEPGWQNVPKAEVPEVQPHGLGLRQCLWELRLMSSS